MGRSGAVEMPVPATRTISHQYCIRGRPEEVFRAVTDPESIVKWLRDTARVSLHKGGANSLGWKDGPTHTGTVLAFVPGKRITLSWAWPGVDLAGTKFTLAVEKKGEGSLLTVEHSGFPRSEGWTDLYGDAEWGWTYFAMNLKSVIEHGYDLRSERDG
jgi:uncharacterized protein YndB with AHSA1/START domain